MTVPPAQDPSGGGKNHGITRQEAVEMVTQLAFYCGWPKAWSTFPLIREVYGEEYGEK